MATATFRAAAAVNGFGLLAFWGGATAKVAKTVESLIVVGNDMLEVGSEKNHMLSQAILSYHFILQV